MPRWLLAAAIASLALSACEREGASPAPPAAVSPERAAGLYAEHCALCHGMQGDGRGPRHASLFRKPRDFRDPRWQDARSDAELRQAITEGVPGTDMPAWSSRLEAAEIAGLVRHVRSFRRAGGA